MSALELLRRLDAEATPGPWRIGRFPWTVEADTRDLGPRGQEDAGNRVATSEQRMGGGGEEVRAHRSPDNARLIATLRTLMPELIAVVESSRAAAPLTDNAAGWKSCLACGSTPDLCPTGALVPAHLRCPIGELEWALKALDAKAARVAGD